VIALAADRAALAHYLPQYLAGLEGEQPTADDDAARRAAVSLTLPQAHGGAGTPVPDLVAVLSALAGLVPFAVLSAAGGCAEAAWAMTVMPGPRQDVLLSALSIPTGWVTCGVERTRAEVDNDGTCVVHLPGRVPEAVSLVLHRGGERQLTHLDLTGFGSLRAPARVTGWGPAGHTLHLTPEDLDDRATLRYPLDPAQLDLLRALTVLITAVAATGVLAGVLRPLFDDPRHHDTVPQHLGRYFLVREALAARLAATVNGHEPAGHRLTGALLAAQAAGLVMEDLSDWAVEATGGTAFSQGPATLTLLDQARVTLPGGPTPAAASAWLTGRSLVEEHTQEDRTYVHP
jgi:hypothetical protein